MLRTCEGSIELVLFPVRGTTPYISLWCVRHEVTVFGHAGDGSAALRGSHLRVRWVQFNGKIALGDRVLVLLLAPHTTTPVEHVGVVGCWCPPPCTTRGTTVRTIFKKHAALLL